MKKIALVSLFLPVFLLGIADLSGWAQDESEEGKTYIVDRTGYRWDITQAVTLGFQPGNFQYGIGKDAFETLENRDLTVGPTSLRDRSRVIGVEVDEEAHAYSVGRLRYHEIANTTIGGRPVAAGY